MLPIEITRMYNILVSFLGESKDALDETYQVQFSCPRCQDRDGIAERRKYHLEVNLAKGMFNCWKCSSIDSGMQGSVYKLIKTYGNDKLLNDYKDAIREFRESSLYKIKFGEDEFCEDFSDAENKVEYPASAVMLQEGKDDDTQPCRYLFGRGIDWRIINRYHIGYTGNVQGRRMLSNRIILPSFNEAGEINYWTGRDFTGNPKRTRYDNAKADRKSIIFNEGMVEWNADITLVEGPFDSIVVPNSIPLLGKQLEEDFKLYHALFERVNARINIFLDNDAITTAKSLYVKLNRGRLKGRIRFIYVPVDENDLDPSKIFQLWGRKGIISFINSARKFESDLMA